MQSLGTAVRNSQGVVDASIVDSQLNCPRQMFRRLRIVALLKLQQSEIPPQWCEASLNRYRFLVVGNGGLLVRSCLDKTELVPCAVILRVILNCASRPLLSFVALAQKNQRPRQSEHGLVEVGVQLQAVA